MYCPWGWFGTVGVNWARWGESGHPFFQVSGEILCLSLGLSPFPLPVPSHPVCPNSPQLTVIHNNIPATGVDWDTGGELGRRVQAGRDILSLLLCRLVLKGSRGGTQIPLPQ